MTTSVDKAEKPDFSGRTKIIRQIHRRCKVKSAFIQLSSCYKRTGLRKRAFIYKILGPDAANLTEVAPVPPRTPFANESSDAVLITFTSVSEQAIFLFGSQTQSYSIILSLAHVCESLC